MNFKRFQLILILIAFVLNLSLYAKENDKLPAVDVKNLKSETINTNTFSNEGKPFIVCFWATWCKPCLLEMNTYSENYEEWQKETGLKIYAVSIDDTRSSKKVAPFVKGRGWTFDVLLDENSDFRKAMNVLNPPHTFICNGKGEIVRTHTGYAQGDEEELLKAYKKAVEDQKNLEAETDKK